MIVKMLHLDLVCVAGEKENTLSRLRELKAVHLDLNSAAGGDVAAAKSEASDLETAVRAILKARKGREDEFSDTRARTVSEILALQEDRDTLASEKERLEKEIKVYAPYGDFDPALARKLIDLGIDIAAAVSGTGGFTVVCEDGYVPEAGDRFMLGRYPADAALPAVSPLGWRLRPKDTGDGNRLELVYLPEGFRVIVR